MRKKPEIEAKGDSPVTKYVESAEKAQSHTHRW